MLYGVRFLCMWATAYRVKVHQITFYTPLLNHAIVFWDKTGGRTCNFLAFVEALELQCIF